jgi:hypothetical protein
MDCERFALPNFPFTFAGNWMSYVFLSPSTVFIFGAEYKEEENNKSPANSSVGYLTDSTFVFDFAEMSVVRKANMIRKRKRPCGYRIDDSIYVFGGYRDTSAELYSIISNSWTNLSNIPFPS